jgi:hypothetical protein
MSSTYYSNGMIYSDKPNSDSANPSIWYENPHLVRNNDLPANSGFARTNPLLEDVEFTRYMMRMTNKTFSEYDEIIRSYMKTHSYADAKQIMLNEIDPENTLAKTMHRKKVFEAGSIFFATCLLISFLKN